MSKFKIVIASFLGPGWGDGFYLMEGDKPLDFARDYGVYNRLGNPDLDRLKREERYGVLEPKVVGGCKP